MRSKFYQDKLMEECFAAWLDEHFYPNFPFPFEEGARINDRDVQKVGVDVYLENKGEEYNIDEKATLHYINRNISTFAFELMNRSSGAQGWLFNHDYITTHYLLCWPNAEDSYPTSKEEFTSSEIMLIKREDLINLLESKGLSESKIKELVNKYLPQVTREKFQFELEPGIRLFFTEWLAEKPVNIVINKSILKQIALFYDLVK